MINKKQNLLGSAVLVALLGALPLQAQTNSQAEGASGLLAALQATRLHNPALAGKRAEVRASEYQTEATRAQRYPSLSAQAGLDDEDRGQGTVQVKQPLWAFGKIDNAILRDETQEQVQQQDMRRVEQELFEDVAQAYAAVQGQRKRLAVMEANIEAHTSLLRHIERRAGGRLASQADVTLAGSRLMQAQTQRLQTQSELSIAEADLQALTRVAIDTRPAVEPEWVELPGDHKLERAIIDNSPGLAHKQQMRELASRELAVERVSAYPTLSLQLDHTLSQDTTNGNNDTLNDSRVMITLEGSISGLGLAARGMQRRAGERLNAAERDVDVTRNELQRRVFNLTTTRDMHGELVEARQRTVASSEATLDSYFRQYRAGKKSWLEVLNMQRELAEQQLQLVQAENDRLRARLTLAVLSGHLESYMERARYE